MDTRSRRLATHAAAAGAAAALALALTACGTPSDRAAIGQTFAAAAHGLYDGDGTAVCAELTQSEIDTVDRDGILDGLAGNCATVMHTLSENLGPGPKAELRHARIVTLTISGTHASAEDSTGGRPDRFVKVGGRWYISGGLG